MCHYGKGSYKNFLFLFLFCGKRIKFFITRGDENLQKSKVDCRRKADSFFDLKMADWFAAD